VLNPFCGINSEHFNRCPADRSLAFKNSTSPTKMFLPHLISGMEQRGKFIRERVMTSYIWTFGSSAVSAREAEVFQSRSATMLFRANVIHLMGQDRVRPMKLTVLTTVFRSKKNLSSKSAAHAACRVARERRALA
jgi:hypothetical protein